MEVWQSEVEAAYLSLRRLKFSGLKRMYHRLRQKSTCGKQKQKLCRLHGHGRTIVRDALHFPCMQEKRDRFRPDAVWDGTVFTQLADGE